ncbi:hypothetical protein KKF86_00750 [bacterium]|nr:hypothetical protein [bacterium]
MKSYNKNIMYMSFADFISSYGSWLFTVAVYGEVYRMTGSAVSLAISFSVGIAPQLLFSIFSIKIPDKTNERNLMIFLDVSRGVILLFSILFVHLNSVLGIFVVQFVIAAANSVFLVMKNHLIKANGQKVDIGKQISILRYYYEISLILGALTASYMSVHYGFIYIVILDSVTFIVSALFLILYRYDAESNTVIAHVQNCKIISNNSNIFQSISKALSGYYFIIATKFAYVFGIGILNMLPAILALKIYKLGQAYVGYYFTIIGICSAIGAFHNSTDKLFQSKELRIIFFGLTSCFSLIIISLVNNPTLSMIMIGIMSYSAIIAFLNIENLIMLCDKVRFKQINIISQSSFFLSILLSVILYSILITITSFLVITTVYASVSLISLFLVFIAIKRNSNIDNAVSGVNS